MGKSHPAGAKDCTHTFFTLQNSVSGIIWCTENESFPALKSCTKLLLQVVLAEEIKLIKLRATRAYVHPHTRHRDAASLVGKSSSEIQVLQSCSKERLHPKNCYSPCFSSLCVHHEHASPKPNPVIRNKYINEQNCSKQ